MGAKLIRDAHVAASETAVDLPRASNIPTTGIGHILECVVRLTSVGVVKLIIVLAQKGDNGTPLAIETLVGVNDAAIV